MINWTPGAGNAVVNLQLMYNREKGIHEVHTQVRKGGGESILELQWEVCQ